MAVLVVQPGYGIAIIDRAGNPAELIVEGANYLDLGIGADDALTEGIVFEATAAAAEALLIFNSAC
ncbi:hypothetical protein [Microbulbifer sp. VAAF005]|uniref:hypothetical protein n=1 Tax=Microbulbifer sp. VAAF005 TaxID=3034230 RepID=UPI0024AE44AC|nr:hypothetical protein [Microbulbifer sp. VAAF005]WHI47473.1 hypothetical protein P0078_03555 [Microbulbifer sp. VAAF005]